MGFVANLMCFSAVQNFESRLSFNKVTDNLKVGTSSETQCRYLALVNMVFLRIK